MALQVWLPLNGDLKNYGCANVTVTNMSAVVDASGKIGKCYSFDGATQGIELVCSDFPTILNGDFSISMWIYNQDGGSRSILFGNYGLTGSFFNIEKTTTNLVRFYWNSNPDTNFNNRSLLSVNKWAFLTITRKENRVTCYINGSYADYAATTLTGTIPSTATKFRIARDYRYNDGTPFAGKINDFRIYDHCLSPKEVKEISKCLVMHYPLDANGLGMPNLVDNSNTFNGWSAASGWTKGISDDGSAMYSFSRTGATSNNWVRLIPTLQINGNNYPNGITVSMDLLTPDKSAINSKRMGALQTYQSNGSRIGWVEPEWNLDNVVNNQWSRISYTFNQTQLLNNNTSGTTYAYTMFSFQLVQNGNISIRKIMITEGNKDQPYTLSLNDIGTTEIDTSGFKYNGTRSGSLSASSDTPRYSCSTYFPSGTGIFANPNMTFSEYTISFWGKHSTLGKMLMGSNASTSSLNNSWYWYGDKSFKYPSGEFYYEHNAGSEAALLGTWTHFVATYDGSYVRIYRNGVAEGSKAASGTMTLEYLSIGIGYTSSSFWENGYVSDFRLYATCLSASDILELYNTGTSIDSGGNVLTYDIQEK